MSDREKRIVVLPPVFQGNALYADHESPPRGIVKEIQRTIGGIGRTIRWQYTSVAHGDEAPISIHFTNIQSEDHFRAAAQAIPPSIATCEASPEMLDEPYGLSAALLLSSAVHVHEVIAFVTDRVACDAQLDDDSSRTRTVELGVERLDRSHWSFNQQQASVASPKQSWYKWDFSWLPDDWENVPFTWQQLADNFTNVSIDTLAMPLRFHVAKRRADALAASAQQAVRHSADARLALCRMRWYRSHVPEMPHVASALADCQVRELLHASYELRFRRSTTQSAAMRERSVSIARAYVIEAGYVARLFGPYRQNGHHVGRGWNPRMFKRLPQYDRSNLPLRSLARMFTPDGSLRGSKHNQSANRAKKRRPRRDRLGHALLCKLRVPPLLR